MNKYTEYSQGSDVFGKFEYVFDICYLLLKYLQIAGDTTFLTDTIHTMATSVMTELVKTENLYTEKSSDGSQTLLEYFSSTLCKNNCSNIGICKSGNKNYCKRKKLIKLNLISVKGITSWHH